MILIFLATPTGYLRFEKKEKMKKLHYLLLLLFATLNSFVSSAQCGAQVNDSLLANYDYVLNATNVTGTAPFSYVWTVTDGNGIPVNYTASAAGDSITIDAMTLQNAYGCIIYQLCVTDNVGCSNCTSDTNTVQVPYSCYSHFTSYPMGGNSVSVTLNSNIPPFMIVQQFLMWTDGDGQNQGTPYMGPNTIVNYVPGQQTQGDKFFLCAMTNLVNGGCIHCDSIPFTTLNVGATLLEDVTLSPNPAQDEINVSGMKGAFTYQIQSINGALIFEGKCMSEDGKVNIPEIPAGTYILLVENENGKVAKRLSKIK